jgi:hypothetical protein
MNDRKRRFNGKSLKSRITFNPIKIVRELDFDNGEI